MSCKLSNLTLSAVIAKVEGILEDYPEYPYQIAPSLPELWQSLLAHVLTHIPNCYTVQRDKLILKNPKLLYPFPVQEQVRMENLIHGGILHLLREHAKWVSGHITQMENSDCALLN